MVHVSQAYRRTGKTSISYARIFVCVGWQVTLCDPIWQVTACISNSTSLQCQTTLKDRKRWHLPCCWSLLHYRQDTRIKTEMVQTCPVTRRWPLRQAYPLSRSLWMTESGKAGEEMDKHRLARSHQPERWRSRRAEKKNPCGWTHHLRDSQSEGERQTARPQIQPSASPAYSPAFARTHCAYSQRAGQAELIWVVNYIPKWLTGLIPYKLIPLFVCFSL